MKLFLLRHGNASHQESSPQPTLTPRGRKEVTLVAGHFKKEKIILNSIWHSPKTRALQTAEIIRQFQPDKNLPLEEKKGLEPEGSAAGMADEIMDFGMDALLVVSHLPLIVDLAYLFAADTPHPNIAFPTAGVAAFEGKGKTWKWLWSLDPSGLG